MKKLIKTIFKKILPRQLRQYIRAKIHDYRLSRLSDQEIDRILAKVELASESEIPVFIQINEFDKGGLEEVVLSLISGIEHESANIKLYLLIVGNQLGYLGQIAFDILGEGRVILLSHDLKLLDRLQIKVKPKLVNCHYSVFGYQLYQQKNIKIVDTIHNNYIWLTNERKNFDCAVERFIAVSTQVKQHYATKFTVAESKITVIPNGIDPERFEITPLDRSAYGFTIDDFIFINVSSFNYNKAHILAVEAFKQVAQSCPHAKLLFVGNILDQNCFQKVVDKIADYKLENKVKIVNYVPKSMVYGLLGMADCFLFPSLIEGWSIAVMEAMYMNLPLILTNIGSAQDVIKDDDVGTIVPTPYSDPIKLTNDDIHNLYSKIENYTNIDLLVNVMNLEIESKKKQMLSVSNLSRNKVINEFSLKTMINKYLQLYNEVIKDV
jgi:glycosyltransferase involved in cell wall biosynthesis